MRKLAKQGNKTKDSKKMYRKVDLWLASRLSFKRNAVQSDWKLSRAEASESNKFLELADIALGLRTTERWKRKATA
jgi:hypothetical protein